MRANARTGSGRRASPSVAAIEVRVATPQDIDRIVEMRLALLREEGRSAIFAEPHPDAPARARRLTASQLLSANQAFLLAVHDRAIIGMLRCALTTGSPLVREARRGALSTAWVHPDYRRRGVLRKLLQGATAWCAKHGAHELRLSCTYENTEGNAAWEALGFEVVEIVRRRRPKV